MTGAVNYTIRFLKINQTETASKRCIIPYLLIDFSFINRPYIKPATTPASIPDINDIMKSLEFLFPSEKALRRIKKTTIPIPKHITPFNVLFFIVVFSK